MNDYYNSLKNSSVRLLLEEIQPDGVTVCPERKNFTGWPSKYRRKESVKTIGAVQMVKRPVGRPRKIKPTGLPSQTSETLLKRVTVLFSKKLRGRP